MDREEYKRFYKYLMVNEVIPEPYDDESFDEYLFDNYESEQCDISDVVVSKAKLCDCNNTVDPNYDPCCSYSCWSKKFD